MTGEQKKNKKNNIKCALKGFPKTEKCHLPQRTSSAIWILIHCSASGDKLRPFYQYLFLLVLRHDLLIHKSERRLGLSMGQREGAAKIQKIRHTFTVL